MSHDPRVIHTEPLHPLPRGWLAERVELIDAAPESELFRAHCDSAQGLVVKTATIVDAELLEMMPALRVVGRAGVGLDNIDLAACRARGIAVVFTPASNTQAVLEYALSLLLNSIRPRLMLTDAVSPNAWKNLRAQCVGERQLNELTVGVLGFGRIGARLAQTLAAIGARVQFNDLLAIPACDRWNAAPVDVETLFETSDLISVHIDGRPSNQQFVSRALLERMKPDVVLLNTARGMLIDTDALGAFLLKYPTARAILDVHDPEPINANHPLLGLPNATLLPHLASRTRSATERMSWVVRDVVAVLAGDTPEWPAPTLA